MASRISTPKQPLTSLATCVIQHVFTCVSDVADDCFGTLIHHAAVVFVVAVAVAVA